MVYQPGQVSHIFSHIDFDPEWFILGGPADGDEAQVFKEKYPRTQVIGIEPNREAYDYQTKAKFPGVLLPYALSAASGRSSFQPNTIRSGWVVGEGEGGPGQISEPEYEVDLISLDDLDSKYGPFRDAVLWLDIEGQEMSALLGAARLLSEKRIRLMNLEIIEERKGATVEIDRFTSWLAECGYVYAGDWNVGLLSAGGRLRRDVIFKVAS